MEIHCFNADDFIIGDQFDVFAEILKSIPQKCDVDWDHGCDLDAFAKTLAKALIVARVSRRGVVYTHFGDDFDNVFALEALRRAGATFEVRRCPAGQAPDGEIWIDVCGPNPGTALVVIDHHGNEGYHNTLEAMVEMGFNIPTQAVEVADADTEGKAKATDYRSVLALLRHVTPGQAWDIAEAGLLMGPLSDEQIESYGLTEARDSQKEVVETAISKLRQYAVSNTVVIATENILGGSFIAYELGYKIFAVITPHEKGGITFAINSQAVLGEEVIEFSKFHGAFIPPHGKMAVLGGFKDPESRVADETVKSFEVKLCKLLLG